MNDYAPWTTVPQPGYEYKYWGWYGPAPTKRHLLSGGLTFFVAVPLLILGLVVLIALVLVAIAVPPVGVAGIHALTRNG